MDSTVLRITFSAVCCVPHWTLVLTAVIIQHAPSMEVPAGVPSMAVLLEGQTWRARADALRRLGRPERAREAVAAAPALFAKAPVNDWFLARLDLVEAPLLEEAGERAASMASQAFAARYWAHGWTSLWEPYREAHAWNLGQVSSVRGHSIARDRRPQAGTGHVRGDSARRTPARFAFHF